MNTCEQAIISNHMGILNLLQVADAMEVDVCLEQSPVGYVARNCIELQRFDGFIQFEEMVLCPEKRTPDLVESSSLPSSDQDIDRRIRTCQCCRLYFP